MNRKLGLLLSATALFALSGCETHPYYGDVRVHGHDYDVRVVFTDRDRQVIRDYYRAHYRGLPPGLAKQGKIPPGHARKFRRGYAVPPEANWQYLPADLERRLSRLPDSYIRVIVGTDVAILHNRTRMVVDLIEDLDD